MRRHHDDFPSYLFRDYHVSTDLFELKCCDLGDMTRRSSYGGDPPASPPVQLEPPIPVVITSAGISIWPVRSSARSPRLHSQRDVWPIPVFREYIEED